MKLYPLVLLLFVIRTVYGQNYEQNEHLVSRGKIPKDFLRLAYEKAEIDRQKIDRTESGEVRRAKKRFYVSNNYYADQMLTSGNVLFNDPITLYINQIADKLLQDNRPLRDSLRFYAYRNSTVNASCFFNGMIFVNLGLIAHLKSEAALALILSHEIVHFTESHSMNEYIDEITTDYSDLTREETVAQKCMYNKEQEMEADLKGLAMYLKAGYDPGAVNELYDLLRWDYLPFEQKLFEKSFFESADIKIPSAYELKEINGITMGTDYDDSKSTHPNVEKRRAYITERAKTATKSDKTVTHFLPEHALHTVVQLARLELSRLYLIEGDAANAFYNSFLHYTKDTTSLYHKKVMVHSLYVLSKYKTRNSVHKVMDEYDEIEGDAQPFYYLIDQMSKQELNALALVQAYKLLKANPKDVYLDSLYHDLFKDLVFENEAKRSYFSTTPKPPKTNTLNYPSYVKRAPSEEELKEEKEWIKYVFVSLLKDPGFVKEFDRLEKAFEVKSTQEKSYYFKKNKQKEARYIEKKGYALGEDKMIFVSPIYFKLDLRRKEKNRYKASEKAQMKLNSIIMESADILNLGAEIMEVKLMRENDVESYNSFCLLQDWFREMNEFETVSFMQNEMEQLSKKLGSNKVCILGAVGLKLPKNNIASTFVLSMVYFPLLPYAIYNAATPLEYCYYECQVFDLAKGKKVMEHENTIHMADSDFVIKANVYNSLMQMKTKRKTPHVQN